MQPRSRISFLLNLYIKRQSSIAQEQELQEQLANADNEAVIKELLIELQEQQQAVPDFNKEQWQPVLDRILQQHQQETILTDGRNRFNWKRIAIAASIILFISFGVYFILSEVEGPHKKELSVVEVPHDVPAPDKNRAQIKLSDGTIVYLDSAANGSLATQNNVSVIKTADGQIIYTTPSAASAPTAVSYNTLSNPRGSRVIDMTLSDGSHVWLNAGSSITYPVAFINNERKITMTGEAYYEIAPAFKPGTKEKQPFIVEANGTTTEVLGTHFNVNAYEDEHETKITLLEGRVRVSSAGGGARRAEVDLTPGKQAVIAKNEAISINNNADLEQILSWKANNFIFSADNIQTIMRQLARWYNVEVKYETKNLNKHFTGIISRSNNISEVLKMLQQTEKIRFLIENNVITVLD